jgi:hypothetical protein
LKKLEYWDKGDTIFQKIWVDNIIESTLSQEKDKWPKDLVKKVEEKGYYVEEPGKDELYKEVELYKEAEIEAEELSENQPSIGITEDELSAMGKGKKEEKEKLPVLERQDINEIVDSTKDDEIDNFINKNVKEYPKNTVGIEQAKKPDDFLTAVEKPTHYQGILISGKNGKMEFEAIEIIDSIISMLNFNPSASHAIGDSLKYILRCGKKDSDNNTTTDLNNKAKQDLLKSAWYIKWASNCL